MVTEQLRKIWKDPVWSTVIATGLLFFLTATGTYFLNWWPSIQSFFKTIWQFFVASTSVPNWLLLILCICAVMVTIALGAICWAATRPSTESKSWRQYTTDNFFNLKWHWSLGRDGDIYNLFPCCEGCEYQVTPTETYHGFDSERHTAFECDACNRDRVLIKGSQYEIESKVQRFIQQKLRTGSWVDAVDA